MTPSKIERFQRSVDRARMLTERHEPALAEAYAATLRKAGRSAARRFRTASVVHSLMAAGVLHEDGIVAATGDPPPWTVPPVNELIDTIQVEHDLLAKTEAVRKAAAADATTPIMSAMGISFSLESPLVKDLVARAGLRAVKISIPGLRDAVIAAITQAFAEGLSVPQTAALIETNVEGLASYQATMLARTDLIGTANAGSLISAKIVYPEGGILKRWVNATDSNTINDGRIRPTHMEANGQAVPIDSVFVVGGSALLYPGDPSGPDVEVINCFPGETLVVARDTNAAFRRWYEGDLIMIETEGFHMLSGTPNHPVLTDAGWKRLIDLEEGDDLVCGAFREDEAAIAPYVDQAPSAIEDIFGSLANTRHPARIAGRRMDFHGDGSEREIEVVTASGLLCVEAQSSSQEPSLQRDLVRTGEVGGSLARDGAHTDLFIGARASTDSIMCSLGESETLLRSGASHARVHGSASPARLDTHLEQPIADDRATDAIGLGESLLGSSFAVSLTKIVKIERRDFSGHVYNLQTETGAYLAAGILSHNCRCSIVYEEPVRDISAALWDETKHPRFGRGVREGGRFKTAAERAREAKAMRDTVEVDEPRRLDRGDIAEPPVTITDVERGKARRALSFSSDEGLSLRVRDAQSWDDLGAEDRSRLARLLEDVQDETDHEDLQPLIDRLRRGPVEKLPPRGSYPVTASAPWADEETSWDSASS